MEHLSSTATSTMLLEFEYVLMNDKRQQRTHVKNGWRKHFLKKLYLLHMLMMIDVISFDVGQMFLFNKSLIFETDVLR